jgi:hypothetical protein
LLDATPSEQLTFLVTATGKPYGDNHFSESFREWCDAAGLPKHCSAHGLRKARCRWMAEHEYEGLEIMAYSPGRSAKHSWRGSVRGSLHCGIGLRLMSARGQTRSFGDVGSMSGLPESGHGWAIYEYALGRRYLMVTREEG